MLCVRSYIILILYTKLNIVWRVALLMYIEDTKRFLNRIDLSVAKKIAVEDTLLCGHIRALDLWRVSLHCPPALPYKPKWLTNVIYNSPIKIRNKTLSLHWWDKKDSAAERSIEKQFIRLVLKSEKQNSNYICVCVCMEFNWDDQCIFSITFDQTPILQS